VCEKALTFMEEIGPEEIRYKGLKSAGVEAESSFIPRLCFSLLMNTARKEDASNAGLDANSSALARSLKVKTN